MKNYFNEFNHKKACTIPKPGLTKDKMSKNIFLIFANFLLKTTNQLKPLSNSKAKIKALQ